MGVPIDKEVMSLCVALNRIPGVETVESCCGHGSSPYHIFFVVEDQEDLAPVCYYADPCHTGHKEWSVIARADCAMRHCAFLLEGPVGAYEASEDIAWQINKWVDELENEEASKETT
jgi:hypothetical protein